MSENRNYCGLERQSPAFLNPQSAVRNPQLTALLFLVSLLLTPCAARGQAAGADKRRVGSSRGAITGRVAGEDGRPLAEAVVQVFKAYARVPGPPLATNTDGDGKFRVSDLEPGLYTVMVMLPGFVNSQEAQAGAGDEARYYRPGDNVSVTLAKGGVITGTVRDQGGEPIVAISVRAVRVRDEAGRASVATTRFQGFVPERLTDDRGVYRIYGLPPGTYIVTAGGGQRLFGAFNAYLGAVPTYFPSSTRDTASEINVRGGEEVSGVDIRFRDERGHAVSGIVAGSMADTNRFGVSVVLKRIGSSETEWAAFPNQELKQSFSFEGVADGEYELTAQQWGGGERTSLSSIPRRVTVRGADITGLTLTLAPLASIDGRVQLDPAPPTPCAKPARGVTVLETAIKAPRDEKPGAKEPPSLPFSFASGATPNERGEFSIRNLLEGSYRLTVRLPADWWYTRSLVLPGAAQPQPGATTPKPAAATASGSVTLKMGQTLAGVAVQIAQDGGSVSGRVRAAAEGVALPANLKVYLVPTERERAEDALRYAEVSPGDDGAFSLTNLAPGRYKLLPRAVSEDETARARPLAWDAQGRARLRRDAEAATILELKPCQRVNDYVLSYAAAK